jgi:hypothetical protein
MLRDVTASRIIAFNESSFIDSAVEMKHEIARTYGTSSSESISKRLSADGQGRKVILIRSRVRPFMYRIRLAPALRLSFSGYFLIHYANDNVTVNKRSSPSHDSRAIRCRVEVEPFFFATTNNRPRRRHANTISLLLCMFQV